MIVMNFLVLPPEVNSARMYVGAGSGPMLAAAAAWEGLAGELDSAASSFGSVTSGLAGASWQGAAASAMTGAAAPYVGWLGAAAGHATGAAGQARAAASAFEAAVAATVHPSVVAINRSLLVSLVRSNLLGLNAPAIAAAEAEYEHMWAQDVAAMVGYHAGAKSVASMLTPFHTPPKSMAGLATRASGLATRAAASDPPPAPPMMSTLQSVVHELTSGVQALATPVSTAISPLMMLMSTAMQGGMQSGAGLTGASGAAPEAAKLVGGALPDAKPLGGGAGLGEAGVSTGSGQARLVGSMSVPPSWQGSMPAGLASAAMSGLGAAGVPDTAAGATGVPLGGGMPMMPMPMGMGGGTPGGLMGRGGASPHVVQNRSSVVPRAGVG